MKSRILSGIATLLLIFGAAQGNVFCRELCVKSSDDKRATSEELNPLLALAIENIDIARVIQLLDQGADPNKLANTMLCFSNLTVAKFFEDFVKITWLEAAMRIGRFENVPDSEIAQTILDLRNIAVALGRHRG